MKIDTRPITSDSLSKHLKTTTIGRTVYAFEQLGSTNNFAKRLAANGGEEGIVVVADRQTRGRGRLQRKWHAPPGKALCFSIILRPEVDLEKLGLLSLLGAVILAQVVEKRTELIANLKWPNDVLLRGKKVCGILVETEIVSDESVFAVMGIGVNVNQETADFPGALCEMATSLRIETNRVLDRTLLMADLLLTFEDSYAKFKGGNQLFVQKEWMVRCAQVGANVKVLVANEEIEGVLEGIDDLGRMILQTDDRVRIIHSGELT